MNKKWLWIILIMSLVVTSVTIFNINHNRVTLTEHPEKFRVSWMTSWATTGQIMNALTHTNITSLYNSKATFPSFLYGPEMNEAARSGRVEATNTGIVPTMNLLAVDDDWVIVARLIYFKLAVVVPNHSKVENFEDLVGMKIGVPFGGGSHPYMLQRMGEKGITEGAGANQIQLVNIKPPEQALALKNGDVDAVATWEPQTAVSLSAVDGKIIDEDIHVGFLTVKKSLAKKNPKAVVALLKAYIEANYYVSRHPKQTDEWFMNVSQFDPELLKKISIVEPNVSAKSTQDVNILISETDIKRSQIVADVMAKNDLIPKKINLKERIDLSYLKMALEQLSISGYVTKDIKILK